MTMLRINIDGKNADGSDAWFALLGENLQEGVSGWGSSRDAALIDFGVQYRHEKGIAPPTDLVIIDETDPAPMGSEWRRDDTVWRVVSMPPVMERSLTMVQYKAIRMTGDKEESADLTAGNGWSRI